MGPQGQLGVYRGLGTSQRWNTGWELRSMGSMLEMGGGLWINTDKLGVGKISMEDVGQMESIISHLEGLELEMELGSVGEA